MPFSGPDGHISIHLSEQDPHKFRDPNSDIFSRSFGLVPAFLAIDILTEERRQTAESRKKEKQ